MKVFVCCSSNEKTPKYLMDDCEKLLDKVFINNDLVFGACEKGIMGLAYDVAKKNNRGTIGICPKIYAKSFDKLECDEEIVTEEILDSTIQIIKKSDAIIVLPGGFGTVYEFFTTLQGKICEEHNLPIILYNSCGYYDELIKFIDKMYINNFTRSDIKELYSVANSIDDVIKILNNYDKKN